MEWLQNLGKQLVGFWERAEWRTRMLFLVIGGLSIAGIVATGIWSSRPQFIPLVRNMAPARIADVVSKLEANGIENKINFAGTVVMVPKSKWGRAKVLVGNDVDVAQNQSAQLEDSLLSDPQQTQFNMLRNREESLARTIERFPAVQNATVHIGQATPSPFIRDQHPTTASIVLELSGSMAFPRGQASAIVSLVADSIEGLTPDNITVVDSRGHVLASGGMTGSSEMYGQYDYRRRIEADLASKANVMLEQMLGAGKAVVRVTADIDFTQLEQEKRTYDPNQKVRTREKIMSKQLKGANTTALGAAGTASNLGNTPAAAGSEPYSEITEENETDYDNAYSVDTMRKAPGEINRLTIAAMISIPEPEDGEESPFQLPQIESLIKQAVGFDAKRGDEIEVVTTKLLGHEEQTDVIVANKKWERTLTIAQQSSLGIASIVALILGLLTIRKLRPIQVPIPRALDRSERLRVISELSEQAKQNPDAVRAVVSTWLEQDADEDRREAA